MRRITGSKRCGLGWGLQHFLLVAALLSVSIVLGVKLEEYRQECSGSLVRMGSSMAVLLRSLDHEPLVNCCLILLFISPVREGKCFSNPGGSCDHSCC